MAEGLTKKKRFNVEQMIHVLKQAEAGVPVAVSNFSTPRTEC
ncbi:MAG TPA: hypothetical protein VHW46_12875 [Terracidiphilus sp.]|jgi:hypothetical protein|nr:hypothetical protein [Terracidiphilus sp.]